MEDTDQRMGKLEGLTVLIVDDDRDVLESFQMAIEAEGADTFTADNGNTGVERCLSENPDVVVLDMMLPGRSGFLALEKIKGREESPAVIMVTANEGRRHHEYAESMGVDAYLLKPVPLRQLIETIARLGEGRGDARDDPRDVPED
ncbi:MAG: two-component system response regulator [Phycisphaerae bacterium]|nr:two-component system response regulator [Phycisphaerae bacterium]|tara:strand:- start:164 stop:601 length:438 start_codon:yes stop_codon:yes gene_type:complete